MHACMRALSFHAQYFTPTIMHIICSYCKCFFLILILKQINLCAISCTYILQTKSHNLYEAAFFEHYENASQIIQWFKMISIIANHRSDQFTGQPQWWRCCHWRYCHDGHNSLSLTAPQKVRSTTACHAVGDRSMSCFWSLIKRHGTWLLLSLSNTLTGAECKGITTKWASQRRTVFTMPQAAPKRKLSCAKANKLCPATDWKCEFDDPRCGWRHLLGLIRCFKASAEPDW